MTGKGNHAVAQLIATGMGDTILMMWVASFVA